MGGTIFVNYRRDDSPGMVGRLRDRLADAFGPNSLWTSTTFLPGSTSWAI